MKEFAKLFDTPHGQLLAYKDGYDAIVIVGADHRGVQGKATLGGYPDSEEGEARCQADFDSIDQAKADAHAASFHAMIDKLTDEQDKAE